MKKQIQIAVLITITLVFARTNPNFAQSSMGTSLEFNGGFNYWTSLDFNLTTPPHALGVGNFLNGVAQPQSALHVMTYNYTPAFFNPGEVFRTDCPIGVNNDISTYWRLL